MICVYTDTFVCFYVSVRVYTHINISKTCFGFNIEIGGKRNPNSLVGQDEDERAEKYRFVSSVFVKSHSESFKNF